MCCRFFRVTDQPTTTMMLHDVSIALCMVFCLNGWMAMSFPGPCDHGWYYRNGTCFLFHAEPKSWADATSFCDSLNASLVQIKYIELNTYLAMTASTIFLGTYSLYWIGLNRNETYTYRNPNENIDLDLNWSPNEPNDGFSACVYYQNGATHDHNCNSGPGGYICQASRSCSDTSLNRAGFLDDNIYSYNKSACLFHYRSTYPRYSWSHAVSSCLGIPAHLVHMTTGIGNFLRVQMSDFSSVNFWIAARPYKEDILYWRDGTVNYMNEAWGNQEPNFLTENCVASKIIGTWHDVNCDQMFHVICEKEAYPYIPPNTNASKQQSTNEFDCTCRCARLGKNMIVNMTLEELQLAVAKLKSELSVNKSSLSSFIRRKTSAGDQRESASIVGYVGSAIICVILGLVIVADLPTVWETLRKCVGKACHGSSISKTHPT
ncbi:secretory phospholipase A2 receptor-like [Argopecten irradians]|uniref:secretory phospholipase A2 receptor-like n=1 Tax=Argopecten irradians TaxID=31199 RepID=UPI00371E6387